MLFFATRAQIKRARADAVRKRVAVLSDDMLDAELAERVVDVSGLVGRKALRIALLEDLLGAPPEPDGDAPGAPPRQQRDLICCSADWAVGQLDFVHGEYRATPMARAWEMVTLLRKSMLVGLSTGFLVLTSAPAQLVVSPSKPPRAPRVFPPSHTNSPPHRAGYHVPALHGPRAALRDHPVQAPLGQPA